MGIRISDLGCSAELELVLNNWWMTRPCCRADVLGVWQALRCASESHLQLQFPSLARGACDFTKADGSAISQLTCPISKLMPTIALSPRLPASPPNVNSPAMLGRVFGLTALKALDLKLQKVSCQIMGWLPHPSMAGSKELPEKTLAKPASSKAAWSRPISSAISVDLATSLGSVPVGEGATSE